MLPFSAESFFQVFEVYNRAIWPTQVIEKPIRSRLSALNLESISKKLITGPLARAKRTKVLRI